MPPVTEPAPPPRPARQGRWRRTLKGLAWVSGVGLLLSALSVVLVVHHYERGLPDVTTLRTGYEPPQVTRVLARDGSLLASLFVERRTLIKLQELPDHVKLAFLAAEDAHFYEHEGLNYLGMLRALVANLRAGRTRQGGSTITQQVVKNVLLEPDRSYERKIRETILARRVEQELSKDEIFGLYLNMIYLGHGRYGVEEASKLYFGKKARDMTLAEAAMLAGCVASPERYSPRRAMDKALTRRRYVLGQMLAKGFITQALYDATVELPGPLLEAPDPSSDSDIAPDVVAEVQRVLEKLAGERARRGGYTVTTTIDPELQTSAQKALRASLDGYQARQKLRAPFGVERRPRWGLALTQGVPKAGRVALGVVEGVDDAKRSLTVRVGDLVGKVQLDQEERYNPQHLPPSAFAKLGAQLRVLVSADLEPELESNALRLALGPEGALVALDARTHELRALVGSYEQVSGGLDRTSRARRQPGSTFKAFVYSYALHSRRKTPATLLELPGSRDGKLPSRTLSVRTALARSDNAAAELLLKDVGPGNVIDWARACGIDSKMEPDLSLALGAYEVTPLELAAAFGTFASGGEYAPPVLITKVVGPDGAELPLPVAAPKRQVMTTAEAYLTTSLLRSVVTQGTAGRAASLGRAIAGKTGTTNQAKDAWFVGYSTELVTAVWVGYDEPAPLGPGEGGAVTALPAFVEFMRAAHRGRPNTEFPRPPGVVVVKIDPATGLLALPDQPSALDEEFLEGTEPTEPTVVDAGAEAGADAGAAGELSGAEDDDARDAPDAAAPVSPPAASGAPAPVDAGTEPSPSPPEGAEETPPVAPASP